MLESHASPAISGHAACRILVCAGSDAGNNELAGMLQSLGYLAITLLKEPERVLSVIAREPLDLIFLDIKALQADGVALITALRQSRSAADLPVLAITPAHSTEMRNAAITAGANDYLAMPFDPVDASLRIKNLLSIGLLQRASQRIQARLENEVAARTAKLDMLIENGLLMSMTRDRTTLIRHTLFEGQRLLHCDAASMYLVTGQKTLRFAMRTRADEIASDEIPLYDPETGLPVEHYVSTRSALRKKAILIADVYQETRFDLSGTRQFDAHSGYKTISMLTVPMAPRGGEVVGVLQFINKLDPATGAVTPFSDDLVPLVEALAAQAAVTLDNLQLLDERKAFVESLIHTIATAIDAKSPYTGRHSARVPELALMLAQAAHAAREGPLASFAFETDDEWHEFRVGAWLHDCGKITTPEYVIDKATKLETIYNRLHEIRMRFEVLLRDADVARWQAVAEGRDAGHAASAFEARKAQLVEDFTFIAGRNIGEENLDLSPGDEDRIRAIGQTTWLRHFDDRLGLAHEELMRRSTTGVQALPATEKLLADQPYHLIDRTEADLPHADFGFKVDVPPHLYDLGEVHNLTVRHGTLTAEERYKINEHMTHGIMMLERMPFPKSLSRVPEYAGTHHETLNGTGYPRMLGPDELSVPARIMMIADIFEALTATDRPYKTPKKFSEALGILHSLKVKGHIDADLFDLFLTSGVHLEFARKFLVPQQVDDVDVGVFLGPTRP